MKLSSKAIQILTAFFITSGLALGSAVAQNQKPNIVI
jgi:hypothetical protein